MIERFMAVLQTRFPPVLNRSQSHYYIPGSLQYSQEDFYFAFAKEKLFFFNTKITCPFGS